MGVPEAIPVLIFFVLHMMDIIIQKHRVRLMPQQPMHGVIRLPVTIQMRALRSSYPMAIHCLVLPFAIRSLKLIIMERRYGRITLPGGSRMRCVIPNAMSGAR